MAEFVQHLVGQIDGSAFGAGEVVAALAEHYHLEFAEGAPAEPPLRVVRRPEGGAAKLVKTVLDQYPRLVEGACSGLMLHLGWAEAEPDDEADAIVDGFS
jgi:hypothetical protein